MALKHLPPTFCWSRIGSETGEDLPTIVLRKEWERRLGGGRFLWGINQSLGNSAQIAALRTGSLLALFSPAASRPRVADVRREDAFVWNAWVDANGQVRQLPQHVFVTSRTRLPSGKLRDHHYALVCASPTELTLGSGLRVQPERLRSVSTAKAPCASQGTVVVDRMDRNDRAEQTPRAGAEFGVKGYPVAFGVELEAPYFVKLVQPTRVKARDMAKLHEAVRNADLDAYVDLTKRLRSEAAAQQTRGVTSDLFELVTKARELSAVLQAECDAVQATLALGGCVEPPVMASCGEMHGETHELFARDLFDMAPAGNPAKPARQSADHRSELLRAARTRAASREADWTQLSMELPQDDAYPHSQQRGRPTLS